MNILQATVQDSRGVMGGTYGAVVVTIATGVVVGTVRHALIVTHFPYVELPGLSSRTNPA